MGGRIKIKKIDSFQPKNEFLLTRSLIPRLNSRKETRKLLDDKNNQLKAVFDLEKAEKNIEKNKSNLFSRRRITDSFFTEDSKLYITPKEYGLIQNGQKLNRNANNWDGVSQGVVENYRIYRRSEKDVLYQALTNRFARMKEEISNQSQNLFGSLTPARAWNLSVVGAILFGMFSMTLIYRYLGEGVSADKISGADQPQVQEIQLNNQEKVLGEETAKKEEEAKYIQELIQKDENKKKEDFEKEIRQMVKGYPIEEMVPYIAQKDRIVAAFLIGIAKKESGWGEHVPTYKGTDCHNLWGYRGKNPIGTGGHSCFLSSKDAIDTVAKRIEFLVEERELNTPAKMSIWKCGSECRKDTQVKKWISDVDLYFRKLNK